MPRPSRAGALLARALVLLTVASSAGHADEIQPTDAPFLWMIEGETPAFLFGTIHLPEDRVIALPDVVEAAFELTEALYTEIPMDPVTMMAAMSGMMLPQDQSLSDVMPAELLARSEKYLAKRELNLTPFSRFKVAFFAAQLTLLDEMEALMTQQPLDAVLSTRAKNAGKDVRALETVEEQVSVFDAFDSNESVEMLRMTLDYLEALDEKGESPTDELTELYLAGDGDKLAKTMYDYLDPDSPFTRKFIDVAISERNQRMATRIEEWMSKEPDRVHFFAVGALHYPMEIGILRLLEANGHEITRLAPQDVERVLELAAAPSAP